MSGPFHAPEGSSPATYKVTITAIVPNAHTDPACWDLDALLEFIRDTASWGAEVESVAAQWPDSAPEVPAEAPELVVSVTKARRSRERAVRRHAATWQYRPRRGWQGVARVAHQARAGRSVRTVVQPQGYHQPGPVQ